MMQSEYHSCRVMMRRVKWYETVAAVINSQSLVHSDLCITGTATLWVMAFLSTKCLPSRHRSPMTIIHLAMFLEGG